MSIHTLHDLCYAYAVADPVREMLFALQDRITELEAKLAERSAEYDAGVTACIARLHEMHRITTGRHNFYGHAALELAKLKEME